MIIILHDQIYSHIDLVTQFSSYNFNASINLFLKKYVQINEEKL